MYRTQSHSHSKFSSRVFLGSIFAVAFALACWAAPAAQAQTFHLLYTFTNGVDGAEPYAAPTLDSAGNLYGTTTGWTTAGGAYELQRHHSSWIFKSLYNFQSQNDGYYPEAPLVFGPNGTLYGTTQHGGNRCNATTCGTVFNLQPPARICSNISCPWTEHPVYWFGGDELNDGDIPGSGPLTFDAAGNIYGTTISGGATGNGTIYQLVRSQNSWTENILYSFPGVGLPGQPEAGVTLDAAGNLYGTAKGYTYGCVYALIHTDQGWNLQTIYVFQGGNDGAYPAGGLIFDAAGNAYGTTEGNDQTQPGSVFKLTPQGDGTWHETVLHLFTTGYGPKANLATDAAGNLYGTTLGLGGLQGDRFGMVFKLSFVNGSWVFTDLYDFTAGTDGEYPAGGVTIDANGNLYGTAVGGAHNFGTVWEVTP